MAEFDFIPEAPNAGNSGAPQASNTKEIDFKIEEPVEPVEAGSHPENPIPKSPLSIVQRAAMGAIKSPVKQVQYFEDTFGKGNVKLVNDPENEANMKMVIKDSKGKWYDADPSANFFSHPSELFSAEMGKDIAQYMGQHSGKLLGAAVGTAVAGPIGAVVGAGIGAVAESSAKGETAKDSSEAAQQFATGIIFQAEQELGGLALKAAGGGIKALGTAIKKIAPTQEGMATRGAVVKFISGVQDGVARAWVENVAETEAYQAIAHSDWVKGTVKLPELMRKTVDDFAQKAVEAKRALGKQYDVINEKTKTILVEPTAELVQPYLKLLDEKYIEVSKKGFNIVKPNSNEVGHVIEGTNKAALNTIQRDMNAVKIAMDKGRKLSYTELQRLQNNLDNHLYGNSKVTDPKLAAMLREMKAAVEKVSDDALKTADENLFNTKKSLDSKYGPFKQFAEELDGATDRVDTFLKKILKSDGSMDATILTDAAETMGLVDPTKKILRMEAGRKSIDLFKPGAENFGGKLQQMLSGSPRMAHTVAKVITAGDEALRQAGAPIQKMANTFMDSEAAKAAIPYAKQMYDQFSKIPKEIQKQMIQNPRTFDFIKKTVTGAAVEEKLGAENIFNDAMSFVGNKQPQ